MDILPDDILTNIVPYVKGNNFSLSCKKFNSLFKKYRVPSNDEIANIFNVANILLVEKLLNNEQYHFSIAYKSVGNGIFKVFIYLNDKLLTTIEITYKNKDIINLLISKLKLRHFEKLKLLDDLKLLEMSTTENLIFLWMFLIQLIGVIQIVKVWFW